MADEGTTPKFVGRGKIFSDTEREYLEAIGPDGEYDGDEFSENYQSTLDTQIQQRVAGAMEDICLFAKLSKKQRKYVTESIYKLQREGKRTHEDGEIKNQPDISLQLREGEHALDLAFLSFIEFYHLTQREHREDGKWRTLASIKKSLEESEQQFLRDDKGGRFNVDVTVEIEDVNCIDTQDALENARQRFEDGEDVPTEELKTLYEAGYIEIREDVREDFVGEDDDTVSMTVLSALDEMDHLTVVE